MEISSTHTLHEFDEELEEIRNQVLDMGGLVEKHLRKSIKSLLKNNQDLAEEVSKSDYLINKMEVDIDDLCTKVIARRQPAAGDLRTLLTATKVITDLERIGDESEKIARFVIDLNSKEATSEFYSNLKYIGRISKEMLREGLDAYVRQDVERAVEIIEMDDELDHEFDNVSRLMITHMMENPKSIRDVLRVNWCARSLERVGDHVRNICEYIIYQVRGTDVRHTTTQEPDEV